MASYATKSQAALADSILGFSQIGKNSAQAAVAIVVAGFALLHSTPAQAVNLVTNGDYETGDLTGWTNTSELQFVATNNVSGNNTNIAFFGSVGSLDFSSQTVTTIAGQNYSLSYDFFSNGTTPNQFQVQVNGTTLFD